MSDSKEAQAARNEVDRQLREENPERYIELMHAAFAKRGLTWSRRLTAEERAERERLDREGKARERIEAEAKKAGIVVSFPTLDQVVDLDEAQDAAAGLDTH